MKLSKLLLSVLIVAGLSIILSHCKKDNVDPNQLQITGFTPESGYVGDLVAISGRNFSSNVADNKVAFNGTSAFIVDANPTTITVAVPPGATTGKIAVAVNGTVVFSKDDFTVFLPALGIASFTPTSGIAGSSVVISGNGFASVITDNVVKFNGVTATVTAASATMLTVMVPNGATTGPITVTVPNGGSGTPITYTSQSNFTVPAPSISGFSPTHAIPGSTVTIAGSNFNSGSLSANTVTINGVSAPVIDGTSSHLTITVPASATTGKIAVTVGGQSTTSATDFEVLVDVPRDGLVAFYTFDGNAKDVSGNHLDGTINGSPTSTADRFGVANQAYAFSGSGDYINMGNPTALQISNKMTVAGWFNINNTGVSSMMALITKIFFDPAQGNNPRRGYAIVEDGNPSSPHVFTYAYTADGTNFTVNQNSAVITTGTWMFVAFVTDGTAWSIYRDDVAPITGSSTNGNANPDGTLGDFVIGAYDGGFNFKGSADDITVYNRALSADEVSQLYKQTVSKY